MRSISIQITYRKGKPFAADGRVLGIEIISPDAVTAEEIMDAFDRLGLGRPSADELAPLAAA